MYPALWYDSSQRFSMSIGFGSSAARPPTHSLTHPLTPLTYSSGQARSILCSLATMLCRWHPHWAHGGRKVCGVQQTGTRCLQTYLWRQPPPSPSSKNALSVGCQGPSLPFCYRTKRQFDCLPTGFGCSYSCTVFVRTRHLHCADKAPECGLSKYGTIPVSVCASCCSNPPTALLCWGPLAATADRAH